MNIYQSRDFETIAKLSESVHDVHAKLYPEYFKEYDHHDVKEFFKSVINIDRFVFLILEDHHEPLGYAWLEIRNYPEMAFNKELNSVYVHQLSITETHRGKGYGSKLMEEVYTVAKKLNIDLIELEYWTENTYAKQFYKNQHFTKTREVVYKSL
ncbi:GNAT family N-acetyltransferase [Domibacillus sp. A3M-37]|uniref:GNAT family N-acetyltransferase n=1 Tax=Domibacillus sp. A3M-37 TaxID=2962037 RepID=UPI0020B7D220|nr:GNAT family N-acetyltransferase [Domibacillus sp. A3M-37]MCP3761088.1 GNAT family N-acetyltransferase [Domibacillus sp. A3M-37]